MPYQKMLIDINSRPDRMALGMKETIMATQTPTRPNPRAHIPLVDERFTSPK